MVFLVCRVVLAATMYVAGIAADSPRETPPCAIADFRRPRALHTRAWQRRRVFVVRLLALLAVLPALAVLATAAVAAATGSSELSALADWAGVALIGRAPSDTVLLALLVLEGAWAVFCAWGLLATLLCFSRHEFKGVPWSAGAAEWSWADVDEDEAEEQSESLSDADTAAALAAVDPGSRPSSVASTPRGDAGGGDASGLVELPSGVSLVDQQPAAAFALGTAAPTCGPCRAGHYPWQTAPPRLDPDAGHPGLRIVILTVGTRGDVQPFMFLARALKERGHDVSICCPDQFQGLVTSYGVTHRSSGFEKVDQPIGWRHARTVAEMLRTCPQEMLDNFLQAGVAILEAVQAPRLADVVISTCHTNGVGIALSEALDVAHWQTKLAPDTSNAAFQPPGYDQSDVGLINRIKHIWYWIEVTIAIVGSPVGKQESVFRSKHLQVLHNGGMGDPGQRVVDIFYTPFLLGYSSAVFPVPDEEPEWAFECGFWMEDTVEASEEYRASPSRDQELVDWLDSRSRQVAAVTFGSMVHGNKGGLVERAVRAALDANLDVLLISGWAEGLADLSDLDGVYRVQAVPHAYAFNLVNVVIHHGGAGTTAAVAAVGCPAVIIPVLRWADQRQWGRKVEEAGLGVILDEREPSRRRITDALRRALRLTDPEARDLALRGDVTRPTTSVLHDVAAHIRARPSAALAARAVESCLCSQVLTPDEMAPLARLNNFPEGLSFKQRMCLRHCVYCKAWRRQQRAFQVRGDEVDRIARLASGRSSPGGTRAVGTAPIWHPLDAMRLSGFVLSASEPTAADPSAADSDATPAFASPAGPGRPSGRGASRVAASPGARASRRINEALEAAASSVPSPAQRLRRSSLGQDDWRRNHLPSRSALRGSRRSIGEADPLHAVLSMDLPPDAYRDLAGAPRLALNYGYDEDVLGDKPPSVTSSTPAVAVAAVAAPGSPSDESVSEGSDEAAASAHDPYTAVAASEATAPLAQGLARPSPGLAPGSASTSPATVREDSPAAGSPLSDSDASSPGGDAPAPAGSALAEADRIIAERRSSPGWASVRKRRPESDRPAPAMARRRGKPADASESPARKLGSRRSRSSSGSSDEPSRDEDRAAAVAAPSGSANTAGPRAEPQSRGAEDVGSPERQSKRARESALAAARAEPAADRLETGARAARAASPSSKRTRQTTGGDPAAPAAAEDDDDAIDDGSATGSDDGSDGSSDDGSDGESVAARMRKSRRPHRRPSSFAATMEPPDAVKSPRRRRSSKPAAAAPASTAKTSPKPSARKASPKPSARKSSPKPASARRRSARGAAADEATAAAAETPRRRSRRAAGDSPASRTRASTRPDSRA